MSVMNYKLGPWWPDEEYGPDFRREVKAKEKVLLRKEIQEALEEMELEEDERVSDTE